MAPAVELPMPLFLGTTHGVGRNAQLLFCYVYRFCATLVLPLNSLTKVRTQWGALSSPLRLCTDNTELEITGPSALRVAAMALELCHHQFSV